MNPLATGFFPSPPLWQQMLLECAESDQNAITLCHPWLFFVQRHKPVGDESMLSICCAFCRCNM